jgi:peptidoglycan/xylan/chitin deacetylase (PgdA/CDA1 family)
VRELILNFHGLGEPHALVSEQERLYWWSASSFARLLQLISERSIAANPQISITFDDGNESDALVALPQLTKYQLKATFFVCAGRIGKAHYLDKAMIKDLIDSGMCIGSHGMHHRDWCVLGPKELDEEIVDARKRIEDVSRTTLKTVAIPFGSYNRRVLLRLKQESWDCIYTSDRGVAYPTAKIKPRETVYASMQNRLLLSEFTQSPSFDIRIRRGLTKIYKMYL